MPLVQHSLQVLLDFYHKGIFSLEDIVTKTSHNTARRFQIKDRGYLREGYFADIAIVDLEKKQLVLKRVPPGDQWTDANGPSEIFESLTDGLEYVFQKSKGSITEFHLSAFKGEIFSVVDTEVPDPEPTIKRWTLYGEEIDKQ